MLRERCLWVFVSLTFGFLGFSLVSATTFQGFGYDPETDYYDFYPMAISGNGQVVVGTKYDQAADCPYATRWSQGLFTSLGCASPEENSMVVSHNGSVIAGSSYVLSSDKCSLFHWNNGTLSTLSMNGTEDEQGGAWHISGITGNGSTLVGRGEYLSYKWENGQQYVIPSTATQDDENRFRALNISSDGTTIVGYMNSDSGDFDGPARMVNDQVLSLGTLSQWEHYGQANDTSANGSVIVGKVASDNNDGESEAFRWENGQMVGLGFLPNDQGLWSEALAVSANGSVIVGWSESWIQSADVEREAFIWDAESQQMRNLKGVLQDVYHIDLAGWYLTKAIDISADGNTIIGLGINPQGYQEGWIVTIPEPCTLGLLALGGLALVKRKLYFRSV